MDLLLLVIALTCRRAFRRGKREEGRGQGGKGVDNKGEWEEMGERELEVMSEETWIMVNQTIVVASSHCPLSPSSLAH